MRINGCDISSWQGKIDYEKLSKEDIFIMIRAGFSNQIDKQAVYNLESCEKYKIPYGIYWASYAVNANDALKEAHVCLDLIKNYKPLFPISFDFEDFSTSCMINKGIRPTINKCSEIVETFCEEIEFHNYYVSIYTNLNFYKNYFKRALFNRFDTWFTKPDEQEPSIKCGMFQYSWTGKLPGISTDVDLNVAYKDYENIICINNLNIYK